MTKNQTTQKMKPNVLTLFTPHRLTEMQLIGKKIEVKGIYKIHHDEESLADRIEQLCNEFKCSWIPTLCGEVKLVSVI